MKTPRIIRNHPHIIIFILCMLFLVAAFSCSDESESPAPQIGDPVITEQGTPTGVVSSSVIGATGGTVSSTDGKLSIVIPNGALSTNTTISIQPITNEGPLGVGQGYRLTPEGLSFAQPVTLEFKYDDKLLDGVPAEFLWIITQADNRSWNALLKSENNITAKTVTVETTHFSDWALGRFIDLSLLPSSKTILKGKSVDLHVTGFSRGNASEEDDLVPLTPIESDGEEMTPLTPIPSVESRLMDFRVKQWTLNGQQAPLSGSNGSLTSSNRSATYTAPNQKPSQNPVAVSVELEGSDKEGRKNKYMLTSSITVVESDLYLMINIDGQEYEYYQYGLNGGTPPDPNNMSLANCFRDENKLVIYGDYTQFTGDNSPPKLLYGFGLVIEDPAVGTKSLSCFSEDGDDEMTFIAEMLTPYYKLDYSQRIKNGDTCETEELCGDASVTLFEYTGGIQSTVAGYFSGTIYEDRPGFGLDCKMPIAHTIEGEFWLKLSY